MNRGAAFRFAKDGRGTAALELALLMPVLLIILVGFYETYVFVRSVSVMERVAFSTADLIARRNLVCRSTSTSDPNSINTYLVTAAPISAEPLDLKDNGEIIVSGVTYNSATGSARVAWQMVSPYTLTGVTSHVGSVGEDATLAGGIVPSAGGDTVITAEVFYYFDWFPMLRNFVPAMPGAMTLNRIAYFRGRVASLAVLNTSATNANCPD